jgi:prepilin-type N-terminal cleavage/methylation domain-containing protein
MGKPQHNGFTIVELIVIIVVIGILAGIGTVSYLGIVRGTRDTERRSAAETYALALGSWARDNDKTPTQTGAGFNGTGQGWLMSTNAGYSTNIETVLLDEEYLNESIVAPAAPDGTNGYAMFACNTSDPSEGRYGVFAILESLDDEDAALASEWLSECNPEPFGSPYNTNFVRVFNFRQ